ncbi:HMG-box [Mucor ambiguus]|uniref:HMG-box n=1 Tax=Mucor ambiguus TaxID=91626 RepID=A0A0C9MN00_9FUNG|nr:HMG-box [Mucor ambiguus]
MINSPSAFPLPNPALKSESISSQFKATSPFSSSSSITSSFSSSLSESIFRAPEQVEKIPRPLNSFMIFRLEKQKDIVEKCPGANHRDISKIISKWWKELGKTEKQWYTAEAEKRKIAHKAMYPNYKYCPKKRVGKPRAYRKRDKSEFVARLFENKQSLSALFKGDMLTPSLSFTSSDDEEGNNSIPCDPKQARECSADNRGFQFIKVQATPSVSTSSIDSSTNGFSSCSSSHPQIKIPEFFGSTLYYPTTTSYYTVPPGAYSVPSQSTAYFHSSAATSNISRTEPLINYNIYANYYGAPNDAFAHNSYIMSGENPAVAAAPNALHYITPSHYLIPSLLPLASFNTSSLYPYDSHNSNPASGSINSSNSSTVSSDSANTTPHLLTQSFAYPS